MCLLWIDKWLNQFLECTCGSTGWVVIVLAVYWNPVATELVVIVLVVCWKSRTVWVVIVPAVCWNLDSVLVATDLVAIVLVVILLVVC